MLLKYNIYFWRGINYTGDSYSGYIFAASKSSVKAVLAEKKIIVKFVTQKFIFKTIFLRNYISSKDLAAFTQQILVTIVSGLSLSHAIKLASSYQTNTIFKYLLQNVINDVESGEKFSTSLRRYPDIFNTFYCNMIEIAESSGDSTKVFNKLFNYLQQIEQFKRRIQKILLYPTLLFGLTLIAMVAIVFLVIPQFTILYKNLGGSLPFATRMVVNSINFINENIIILLIIKFLIIGCNIFLYKNSTRYVRFIDRIMLSAPLFGGFFHKLILVKCINILYVTYTSGNSLIECLQHAKLISKNYIYIKFIDDLIIKISTGDSFKYALRNSSFFPKSVINILGLGDESSNLDEMLNYLSAFYESDIQRTFDMISALSEPLIMAFLGTLIGFLVYTIYFPIINIGTLV